MLIVFRTYDEVEFKPGSNLNVIVGPNGNTSFYHSLSFQDQHSWFIVFHFFSFTLSIGALEKAPQYSGSHECILSWAFVLGDQGDYSCSSEACQDNQKLNSFTPFPSFTAYFTNSISQVIIHPKNMQFMERLAFFLHS